MYATVLSLIPQHYRGSLVKRKGGRVTAFFIKSLFFLVIINTASIQNDHSGIIKMSDVNKRKMPELTQAFNKESTVTPLAYDFINAHSSVR